MQIFKNLFETLCLKRLNLTRLIKVLIQQTIIFKDKNNEIDQRNNAPIYIHVIGRLDQSSSEN